MMLDEENDFKGLQGLLRRASPGAPMGGRRSCRGCSGGMLNSLAGLSILDDPVPPGLDPCQANDHGSGAAPTGLGRLTPLPARAPSWDSPLPRPSLGVPCYSGGSG